MNLSLFGNSRQHSGDTMSETKVLSDYNPLEMTIRVVEAYVYGNKIAISELPELINSVHCIVSNLIKNPSSVTQENQLPAIGIEESIKDDFIICLEDGKKLKMLKRYLRSNFGLSPDEYRKKWKLPPDYPMVAPNYAIKRSEFAKKIGLGRGVRSI